MTDISVNLQFYFLQFSYLRNNFLFEDQLNDRINNNNSGKQPRQKNPPPKGLFEMANSKKLTVNIILLCNIQYTESRAQRSNTASSLAICFEHCLIFIMANFSKIFISLLELTCLDGKCKNILIVFLLNRCNTHVLLRFKVRIRTNLVLIKKKNTTNTHVSNRELPVSPLISDYLLFRCSIIYCV